MPTSLQYSSTTTMLRIDGRELRASIRPGDSGRPPLVMFGGIGAGLEVLNPLVDALDPAIEVVRVDVPGIGGSPAATLPYSLPQLAFTMSRLLDSLGYGQVDVLGYSWGGALAQQLALQHRARSRRLVLISTNSGVLSVPGDASVLRQLLTPRTFSSPDDAVLLVEHARTAADTAVSPAVRQQLRDTRRGNGVGYLQQLLALSMWTSLPVLPLITQPTLVLSGDDDPIVPVVNARILAGLIPRATLATFPGGHIEIVRSAPAIGRRVSDFLGQE